MDNDRFSDNGPNAGTVDRAQILRWLDANAPDLSPLYEGAVALLEEHVALPGRKRFIAHAMREIVNRTPGAVDDVLTSHANYFGFVSALSSDWERFGPANPLGGEQSRVAEPIPVDPRLVNRIRDLLEEHRAASLSHRERAARLFELRSGEIGDHPGAAVAAGQWRDIGSWAAANVHASHGNRPISEVDVRTMFDLMERALFGLVGNFFDYLPTVQALLKQANGDEPLERGAVLTGIAHAGHYAFFFDHLDNPARIPLLLEWDFFQRPARTRRGDGWYSFPSWPESRYLLRMTVHESCHEEIARAVSVIPDTDNERVLEDIVLIALELPGAQAARVAQRAIEWDGLRFDLTLPDKLAKLCVHLLAHGERRDAIKLAQYLLSPSMDDTYREPIPKFGMWQYEQATTLIIPAMLDHGVPACIGLLTRLITTALARRELRRESDSEDYSWIWRPDLERSRWDHDRLLDVLVSCLADACQRCARNPKNVQSAIRIWSNQTYPLFMRFRLYLAHLVGNQNDAKALLLDHRWFARRDCWREYGQLAQAAWPTMTTDERNVLLRWIYELPSARAIAMQRPTSAPDPEYERVVRDWLSLFRDQLAPNDATHLAALETRFGPAHEPWEDDGTDTSDSNDPPQRAPMLTEGMDISHVAEVALNWEPSVGSSLEAELATLTRERARDFADQLNRFIGVQPALALEILTALASSVRDGRAWDWDNILTFCEWVLKHPIEDEHSDDDAFDIKPQHWAWAKKQALGVVSKGLDLASPVVPIDARGRVWELIGGVLLTGSVPENMTNDPVHESINTLHGEATHAAVLYALWVRKALDNPKSAALYAPEFTTTIQELMASDTTLAFRGAIGQWLPWLALLDEVWMESNLRRAMPRGDQITSAWEAVMVAYLRYCSVYDSVFRMLKEEYATAVSNLGAWKLGNISEQGLDKKLGEHLMLAVGRGLVSADEAMVKEFFDRAAEPVRARAIEFVGRSLSRASDVPKDTLQRFHELWAWRADTAEDGELAAFGDWMAVDGFGLRWRLGEARSVVLRCGRLTNPLSVMRVLGEGATMEPLASVLLLGELIQNEHSSWQIFAWINEIGQILERAQSSVPNAVAEVVDALGRRGHTGFAYLWSRDQ